MFSLIKNLRTALAVIFGFALSTGVAFAGHESSGGGDQRCNAFYEMASELSISLVKIGQTKIDQVNPLIHAAETRNVVLRPLKVLPVKRLDRQARSYPDEVRTDLDVKQWDQIPSQTERLKLVAHELMVLTGAEADGEYIVSRDLVRLVNDARANAIIDQHKADAVVVNANGTYTFATPRFGADPVCNWNFNGVCKYLGFYFSIDGQIATLDPKIGPIASFDDQGSLQGTRPCESYLTFITCSDN